MLHTFAGTDETNKAGETPLSLASAGGHLDTVKYLVEEHNCDPRGGFIYLLHPTTILAVCNFWP